MDTIFRGVSQSILTVRELYRLSPQTLMEMAEFKMPSDQSAVIAPD